MVLALALCLSGECQEVEFSLVRLPQAPGEKIRGAALASSQPFRLYTWGNRLLSWEVPHGKVTVLREGEIEYGEGGCLCDVNGDRAPDLVVLERAPRAGELGRMVWLEAPHWSRHVIDSGAEFRDCLAATLHGRRGVLVIHRYLQIRFYEVPPDPTQRWPYREIYSLYTPSNQGGLLVADIDGDGLADIVAGNYWIRSPKRFELSWRLFAINLWTETPESAMNRLAFASLSGSGFPELIAAQSDMPEARLAWFSRPDDATQLWPQHRLEGALRLRHPRALAAGDLDGDGLADIAAGELNGRDSRLIVFRNRGGGRFTPVTIGETSGLLQLWLADLDGDGATDILGVGPESAAWWRSHLRK